MDNRVSYQQTTWGGRKHAVTAGPQSGAIIPAHARFARGVLPPPGAGNTSAANMPNILSSFVVQVGSSRQSSSSTRSGSAGPAASTASSTSTSTSTSMGAPSSSASASTSTLAHPTTYIRRDPALYYCSTLLYNAAQKEDAAELYTFRVRPALTATRRGPQVASALTRPTQYSGAQRTPAPSSTRTTSTRPSSSAPTASASPHRGLLAVPVAPAPSARNPPYSDAPPSYDALFAPPLPVVLASTPEPKKETMMLLPTVTVDSDSVKDKGKGKAAKVTRPRSSTVLSTSSEISSSSSSSANASTQSLPRVSSPEEEDDHDDIADAASIASSHKGPSTRLGSLFRRRIGGGGAGHNNSASASSSASATDSSSKATSLGIKERVLLHRSSRNNLVAHRSANATVIESAHEEEADEDDNDGLDPGPGPLSPDSVESDEVSLNTSEEDEGEEEREDTSSAGRPPHENVPCPHQNVLPAITATSTNVATAC